MAESRVGLGPSRFLARVSSLLSEVLLRAGLGGRPLHTDVSADREYSARKASSDAGFSFSFIYPFSQKNGHFLIFSVVRATFRYSFAV